MSGYGFRPVTRVAFGNTFTRARLAVPQIADATSAFDWEYGADFYLTTDNLSGFAVQPDGELVFVFSLARGRGDNLVREAIRRGAVFLDCFEGHLTELYSRHGFQEVKRVPNWTPGQPDVVYMALPGYADRHGA